MRSAIAGVLFLLSACTAPPEGIQPLRDFNAERFLGTWYEIDRLDHGFERGLSRVTATYTARPDNSITVLNRGLDAERCRWKVANARAVFRETRDVASLSVTFFWPFAGGYHVIDLDRDGYQWALVTSSSRSYLWILARQPTLDPAIRNHLIDHARALRFPVDELIQVDQSPSPCPDTM